MPNRASLAVPRSSLFESAEASQNAIARIRERGRRWILAGWGITMIGVFLYCRLLFAVDAEGDMSELLHRTGLAGWAVLLLMVTGAATWLAGNLIYLKDALNSDEVGPDGAPKHHGTL
ncbi:hypothetical protein GETHLI_12480 [Geothrix limicola]|uniref:DUF485 domain-containing protein n=1 Tax=Geothrix limicola TaxID=2927978 RepID=A0ABQ5QEI4_9BACT|nr:hypothetical protein [Geothrix limicola]GLH72746.1 hypothetical protein GETHLI_12480 [Geothrix limicola]